jgi:hypothetical protein
MRDEGLIRHIGPNNGGHWEIINPDVLIEEEDGDNNE